MNRRTIGLVLLLISVHPLLNGCYPKRIVWTPDGKQAAIIGDHGLLYFTDAQGNLSSSVKKGVQSLDWFPDGEHLAVEYDNYAMTWSEAKMAIPQHLRDELVRYAQVLLDVKNKQQWQTKIQSLQELHKISRNELRGIKMYIRDNADDTFPRTLIDSWGVQECDFHCYDLKVGQWRNNQFTFKKTLFSSEKRIWGMRVSRHGRALVFTTAHIKQDDEPNSVSSLWLADLETDQVQLLDSQVAWYPDWDTQGTSLIYTRSIGKGPTDNAIGTLLKRRVCDEQGRVIQSPLPDPEALAGLVVNDYSKVRCLSDGRILFSSMEVTLPMIGKDVPEQLQLFVLDSKRQATITRLIPRSVLAQARGYDLNFFEVSPDETMVSFPDGKGRVGVLTLAGGEFRVLQGIELDNLRTVPVWRYPRDLCYVDSQLDKKQYNQLVLHQVKDDQTWDVSRCISEQWPKKAKAGWLEPDNK